MIHVSVILPCYEEGAPLEDCVRRIERVLERSGCLWEIIAVDDASPDDTLARLRQLESESEGRLRVVAHSENTGRGGAVADGIRAAHGQYCGFLDVDLEVGPDHILSMLEALKGGADVVTVDRRYAMSWHPSVLVRNILSKSYRTLAHRLLSLPCRDSEAGFKFFRRDRILPVLNRVESTGWFWDTEILVEASREGLKIEEVPVVFSRRRDYPSSVRLLSTVLEYAAGLHRLRSANLVAR